MAEDAESAVLAVEDSRYDEVADRHYGEFEDDPPRSTWEELAHHLGLLETRADDVSVGLAPPRPPVRPA